MKKLVLLAVLAVFAIALAPLASNALTISPPIVELDLNKGDVVSQNVKIMNDSGADVTYYLAVQRFIAAPSGDGAPEFIEENASIGLASWMELPFSKITVKARETLEVPVVVRVPNNASPGGNYAALFIGTEPPTAEGSQVGLTQRIGTLFLVRIAGQVRESATVTQFKTDAKSYSSLPVKFSATIDNIGNVHIKPAGNIVIRNMFGRKAAVVPFNDKGGNILPDSDRTFDSVWTKTYEELPKATTFWAKYQEQKDNFAFGKYTAELNAAYGSNKALKQVTSFWVFPVYVIIVQLIFWIIIILILVFAFRKYNDWLITRYELGKIQKRKK